MKKKIVIGAFVYFLLINFKIAYSEVFIKAKVNNHIITNIDVKNERNYLLALNPNLRNLSQENINLYAVDSAINEKIKKIEIEKKFEITPEKKIVKKVITDLYSGIGINNMEEFEKYLLDYEINIGMVKKKIAIEIAWNDYIVRKFNSAILVDETKIRDKINQISSKSSVENLLLSEIIFTINENENLKDKFDKINESIKKIGFEETAKIYSVSESKKNGGQIGWVYKSQLSKIEKKFGVPQSIILSIWGIESDFGTVKLEFSALKAIVFHIYNGKRKKFYKDEFNHILKIIKQDKINIKKMLGSSYGAMGQPQFMPSNYIKYGYDFNNDEKVDLWNSESDTLASIANFLNSNGWEKNLTWGAEVTKNTDLPCYTEGPNNKKSITEWELNGINLANVKSILNFPNSVKTSLLLPKGEYGPKFLVTNNFYILKKYNFSDFYALYVSIFADLIEDKKFFQSSWTSTVELNQNKVLKVQSLLMRNGYDVGGLDGLIGIKTRQSIGKYQEKMKQKITCYPN